MTNLWSKVISAALPNMQYKIYEIRHKVHAYKWAINDKKQCFKRCTATLLDASDLLLCHVSDNTFKFDKDHRTFSFVILPNIPGYIHVYTYLSLCNFKYMSYSTCLCIEDNHLTLTSSDLSFVLSYGQSLHGLFCMLFCLKNILKWYATVVLFCYLPVKPFFYLNNLCINL